MRVTSFRTLMALCCFCSTAYCDVILLSTDFDAETVGTIVGTNGNIGTTGFRTRNSLNAEVVNPDMAFGTASGNALQLRTNSTATAGFGAISPVSAISLPSLNINDIIRVSFDMLIQAVPASSTTVEFQLRPNSVNDGVNEYDFVDLHSGTVGDVVSVSADFLVNGTTLPTTISSINTFLHFEGTNNNFAADTDIAQIDNLNFSLIRSSVSTPEPSSFAFLVALGGAGYVRRRRQKANAAR